MSLDRAGAERLDPLWVTGLLEDSASRVVVANADGVLVTSDRPESLLRVPVPARADRPADAAWPVMLGLEDGVALFAELVRAPINPRCRACCPTTSHNPSPVSSTHKVVLDVLYDNGIGSVRFGASPAGCAR